MGVGYYTDPDDFCEEHPDVVILSTSILSLEQVGRGSVARLVSNSIPLTFVSSTHMAILFTSILSLDFPGSCRMLQLVSVFCWWWVCWSRWVVSGLTRAPAASAAGAVKAAHHAPQA